uniref:Uncharacterized protein n=1 Tax=Globodera pallida TaxID=36090 RepID=A0A183CLM1_GLOPA
MGLMDDHFCGMINPFFVFVTECGGGWNKKLTDFWGIVCRLAMNFDYCQASYSHLTSLYVTLKLTLRPACAITTGTKKASDAVMSSEVGDLDGLW